MVHIDDIAHITVVTKIPPIHHRLLVVKAARLGITRQEIYAAALKFAISDLRFLRHLELERLDLIVKDKDGE